MITTFYVTICALLAAGYVVIAYRLIVSLQRFTIRKDYTSAVEAPSVSVCIPARNETHAMTECLERVLASDYRKLEVIVYDDSSVDDTSILIRSFAHAGVRFVPGGPLPDGWLGKNHALSVLANEASGTYVLFMDVDTIIERTTISQLVGYTMTEGMVMTSVIPGRINTLRQSVLFSHLRYYWQLIVSRPSAPATSSSLWMINRHVLLDTLGGFNSHKAEVEPESHIAAIIGTSSYHCLVSNADFGVQYEKKWRSQVETSRRLLYPMMGGNFVGGLLGLATLLLLNLPLAGVLSGLWTEWSVLQWVSLLFLVLFGLLYSMFTYRTWRGHWWLAMVTWPVVVLQELVLAFISIAGYIRGTVTWKGRTVQPVQRQQPHVNS